MDSILVSIKKLLGSTEEYKYFDPDIIMHINSAFSILHQIGIGPASGFRITGESETWEDYLGSENMLYLGEIQIYVYLKVKLGFDPSSLTGSVIESIKQQISELEWRLNFMTEVEKSK